MQQDTLLPFSLFQSVAAPRDPQVWAGCISDLSWQVSEGQPKGLTQDWGFLSPPHKPRHPCGAQFHLSPASHTTQGMSQPLKCGTGVSASSSGEKLESTAAPPQAGVTALKEGWQCRHWLEGPGGWGGTLGQDLTWLLGGLAPSFSLRQHWGGGGCCGEGGGCFLMPKTSSGLAGLKERSTTTQLPAGPQVVSPALQEQVPITPRMTVTVRWVCRAMRGTELTSLKM